ncbi:MAG TPA: hypothetical protein VN541_00550 [Tepidisphaeraceae bacterium]|nr:hypothetical protein [Tepidisphaeraceae bacterium]
MGWNWEVFEGFGFGTRVGFSGLFRFTHPMVGHCHQDICFGEPALKIRSNRGFVRPFKTCAPFAQSVQRKCPGVAEPGAMIRIVRPCQFGVDEAQRSIGVASDAAWKQQAGLGGPLEHRAGRAGREPVEHPPTTFTVFIDRSQIGKSRAGILQAVAAGAWHVDQFS